MMVNIGLEPLDIAHINAVFVLHTEVEQVILYGSRAKGNYKPYSDIDLTLVGEQLNLTIQQQIENELDDLLLPNNFDLSIYYHLYKDLLQHVKRVGKLFYIKS